MKIYSDKVSYPSAKLNTLYRCRVSNNLQTDVFQKSNNVSFKGVQGLFKTAPESMPILEILPNTTDNFISKITKQMSEFAPEWLKKFKSEGYKIILSPTFKDAYRSQRVFDLGVEIFEITNPKGTLGVTYTEGKYGKNFFVFCDKPPSSDVFMNSIVNHEFSHGIVNIAGVDKSPKAIEMIKKDVDLITKDKKLDKLTPHERAIISHYFFSKDAHLPIDELAADACAWNMGGGIYGSKLILGVDNPNLIQNLFPNLSTYMKTIKP